MFAGRFHYRLITFCQCEPQVTTLLRFGFWPSSPTKPTRGFSVELLELLCNLMLEAHVSVRGFIQSLRWKNQLSEKEVLLHIFFSSKQ